MKSIGHRIIRLEEAGSTNTVALETEAYLEEHGLVLVAERQTAGRGRLGRRWASLPGKQLEFSVVLHPVLPPEEVPLLSLVVAVAVAEAIEEKTGLQPALKWPNDVMIEGRKACGILLEGRPGGARGARVVVGIGINCGGAPEDFPEELRDILTTLSHAGGRGVARESLLEAVLTRLQARYRALGEGGRPALLQDWTRRALLEGCSVRFNTPDGEVEGAPLGLTAEGYLLVQGRDGDRYVQISGEMVWTLP